jgi:hypothetical protein
MGEKNNNNTVETNKFLYSFTILQAGKGAGSIPDILQAEKVAGSIPDNFIRIYWHKPPGRTMDLEFNQPQQK